LFRPERKKKTGREISYKTPAGFCIPGTNYCRSELPANHTHHTWTTDEEVILQIYFTDPSGITFINPADDPRNKAQ
jgi:hypothetical protein